MSLAERSVTSVAWNTGTNLVKVAILLGRSIILARLLPVEVFGVYTLATSIVTFSGIIPTFGMGSAFIHRVPETADEEQAAAVQFTLRLLLSAVWAAAMVLLAWWLAEGAMRLALIVLTPAYAVLYLTDTPKYILTRRIQHRRLAVLDLLVAILTTVVAIGLAWRGYGLITLLATDIVTVTVTAIALYGWRRVWRPRLLWLPGTVRYYLTFGSRAMAGTALGEALDNVDDIWVGANLGNYALGLYSRAYAFATYPRRVLAFPVNLVAGGTLAELKEDRLRMSQAFFRTNSLLIHSGFLMGGLLVLVAEEFVAIALGDKWLPMVTTFQLMAVFTLLDPLRVTVSQLFYAVGQPARVVRVRTVQLIALVSGLYLVGQNWGIVGVAIIVDIVLLIGLIPLLIMARKIVDFSFRRLFAAPIIALIAGASVAMLGLRSICGYIDCSNDWYTGIIKGTLFVLIYGATLFILERQEILTMTDHIRRALRKTDQ